MSTAAPTKQECLEAAAAVILAAAIRIEGERAAAWADLKPRQRQQIERTVLGCWISKTRAQPTARRLCDEPHCIYPPHLAEATERHAA